MIKEKVLVYACNWCYEETPAEEIHEARCDGGETHICDRCVLRLSDLVRSRKANAEQGV